jgi:hypothetical protein
MKKIILLGLMFLLLTTFVSATRFTQEQLNSLTNEELNQILTTKIDYYNPYIRNGNLVIGMKTITIIPRGKFYIIKPKQYYGFIPLEHWKTCRETYSYQVCRKNLITDLGTYTANHKTIREQIKDKILLERNKINSWKK